MLWRKHPECAKGIKCVTCGSNQPSLQKHCKLGLKGAETGRNKGRLLDFWNTTGRKQQSCLTVNRCYLFLRKGKNVPTGARSSLVPGGRATFSVPEPDTNAAGQEDREHPPQKDYVLKLQNLMDFTC